jgi:hypothetical protein
MNGDCSVIEIPGVRDWKAGQLFDKHRERIASSVLFFRL